MTMLKAEKPSATIARDHRKMNKVCVEKRRRERINQSLTELKALMAQTSHVARFKNLEKAEILEMTVNYLKKLQPKVLEQSNPEETRRKFTHGYSQCATEILRYVTNLNDVTPDVKDKLMYHLHDRMTTFKPSDGAMPTGHDGLGVYLSASPDCRYMPSVEPLSPVKNGMYHSCLSLSPRNADTPSSSCSSADSSSSKCEAQYYLDQSVQGYPMMEQHLVKAEPVLPSYGVWRPW